ncbi:PepSY domain-containing protein [Streptomyces sp. NBC_01525]|uniref:PepSY domain-containing protein n=1 Tax=Streptomyces sp. NBC_01525 TaxID=2903893 RepID=UPI0038705E23
MKRRFVLAATAATVLIAGGATTAVAVTTDDGPGSPQSGAQTSAQLAATAGADGADGREESGDAQRAAGAKTGAAQAAVAAVRAVPGTVTEIELDEDRGALVWEADVLGRDGAWHGLTLDALTTRVLHSHVDRDTSGAHGQDRARAALRGTTVGAADAARAVGQRRGTVTSVDFEDDPAKAVWEVETVTRDGREHTYLVDPRTAAVSAAPADDDHADHDGAGDHDGADD